MTFRVSVAFSEYDLLVKQFLPSLLLRCTKLCTVIALPTVGIWHQNHSSATFSPYVECAHSVRFSLRNSVDICMPRSAFNLSVHIYPSLWAAMSHRPSDVCVSFKESVLLGHSVLNHFFPVVQGSIWRNTPLSLSGNCLQELSLHLKGAI